MAEHLAAAGWDIAIHCHSSREAAEDLARAEALLAAERVRVDPESAP